MLPSDRREPPMEETQILEAGEHLCVFSPAEGEQGEAIRPYPRSECPHCPERGAGWRWEPPLAEKERIAALREMREKALPAMLRAADVVRRKAEEQRWREELREVDEEGGEWCGFCWRRFESHRAGELESCSKGGCHSCESVPCRCSGEVLFDPHAGAGADWEEDWGC